jgi:hypothetical protein
MVIAPPLPLLNVVGALLGHLASLADPEFPGEELVHVQRPAVVASHQKTLEDDVSRTGLRGFHSLALPVFQ